MKKKLKSMVILFLGIILIAITGCSSKSASVHEASDFAEEFNEAPEWVLEGGISIEEGLSGVGSSKIGHAGVGFARTEAMALARNEIARQIEVKVQDMVKNFTQQIGVGEQQTVDHVTELVSRQVTQQSLSGSRQQDSWISPSSTLYVLVTVDSESVQRYVKNSVITSLQSEQALWQKFQAEKAFKELEEQIQKQFGGYASQP